MSYRGIGQLPTLDQNMVHQDAKSGIWFIDPGYRPTIEQLFQTGSYAPSGGGSSLVSGAAPDTVRGTATLGVPSQWVQNFYDQGYAVAVSTSAPGQFLATKSPQALVDNVRGQGFAVLGGDLGVIQNAQNLATGTPQPQPQPQPQPGGPAPAPAPSSSDTTPSWLGIALAAAGVVAVIGVAVAVAKS